MQVSDIWSSLPFANTQCTGTISGVTVFKLFELSTREAKFVSERVQDGDRLFQVSGLRYAYNTELEAPRLVKLEIWDAELEECLVFRYACDALIERDIRRISFCMNGFMRAA